MSSENSYGGNCSFSSHFPWMSSFIEYGPLTESSTFTLGNLSVKNFLKAFASATGSGVSAATADGMPANTSAADASAAETSAAEVNWIADRTFTSPWRFQAKWTPVRVNKTRQTIGRYWIF